MLERRIPSRPVMTTAAAMCLAACSLVTPLGGLSSSDDRPALSEQAPEGGALESAKLTNVGSGGERGVDASSDASSDASTAITLPSLVTNGDFEAQGVVCSPWTSGAGSPAEQITPGHASAHACRVCADVQSQGALVATGPANPVPGTYRIEAWVRATVQGARILVHADYGDQFAWRGEITTTVTGSQHWQFVQAVGVVPANMTWTKAVAEIRDVAGACIEVDDVSFVFVSR
jgi:hypothetical protein